MEFLKVIFSWIGENILDIALVVVGASAFITYVLQAKAERKTAAALIVEQIDSIEKIVEDLKDTYLHNNQRLDDNTVYLSRQISYDGAWSKYKHLMIKKLSNPISKVTILRTIKLRQNSISANIKMKRQLQN